ncbi:membrane protein [Marinobacterium nitratireducens]|uniref:Membrane protein n=1 Tax=Marinobacterium nitratireducens TaxID=518897 RepID=A0A917ZJ47_9GAMM|nr:FxsA family protein [Marinobacterium nitratireducens]GGO82944.1 membrane protein [Marinobacterium nitratireducens]
MPFLFLLFIIIPIVEITVLINVGQLIGTWYTVGLVLLSAFIGVNMLRYQGLSTLARAQQRANAGEIPAREMVEGIVLAVGGALLITPGFVTDFIGFCCLIPVTRRLAANALIKRFTVVAMSRQQMSGFADPDFQPGPHGPYGHQDPHGSRHHEQPTRSREGDVIDGEYRREDD